MCNAIACVYTGTVNWLFAWPSIERSVECELQHLLAWKHKTTQLRVVLRTSINHISWRYFEQMVANSLNPTKALHVARACGMTGYCDHYGYRSAEWKSIVTLKSMAWKRILMPKKKKKKTRRKARKTAEWKAFSFVERKKMRRLWVVNVSSFTGLLLYRN